jgi:hypothetical protein
MGISKSKPQVPSVNRQQDPTLNKEQEEEDKVAEAFLCARSVDKVEGIPPYQQWSDKAKARTRVVLNGDTTPAEPTKTDDDTVYESVNEVTFQKEFESFCERCPQWSADDVALFWKTYEHITDLLVIRCQRTGLCFMHAPVTLQHYLVCICKGKKSDTGIIDIASYINKYWKSDKLADYLFRNRGGDSYRFFLEINHHVPDLRMKLDRFHMPNVDQKFWESMMVELQSRPVLLSNFTVRDSFQSSVAVSFNTFNRDEKEVGQHAMLIVGGRKSEDEYYFLLQNWWSGRYFIEVSSTYLQETDSVLTFVRADIESIPEDLPTTRATYAETTADCSEKLDEMSQH